MTIVGKITSVLCEVWGFYNRVIEDFWLMDCVM